MVAAGASENALDRREAVRRLLSGRGEALLITGLGSASWDAHASGDRDDNFYLWGAMGGAAAMGLGLALAQPARRVMVITGDGEQLMALGALATIGVAAPANLDIFVLDNQHYAETGMQASHTGHAVDIAAIAAASGFATTGVICDLSALDRLTETLTGGGSGPRLFVLKIRADMPPRSLPPRDAVYLKTRFRARLGLMPV